MAPCGEKKNTKSVRKELQERNGKVERKLRKECEREQNAPWQ